MLIGYGYLAEFQETSENQTRARKEDDGKRHLHHGEQLAGTPAQPNCIPASGFQ